MVLGGEIIDLRERIVMAIVNVTTDSFYDGGTNRSEEALVKNVQRHLDDGAAILDIGACSTRPGAVRVSLEQELKDIEWALKVLKNHFPDARLSIDTYRRQVAERALELWGEIIVNDIYAGEHEGDMIDFVAHNSLPYIAMHYSDCSKERSTVEQIIEFFHNKIEYATTKGANDFIVDVGFGFGKDVEQNFDIVREFERFAIFDKPLLVGLSRKSMIWRTLGVTPDEALSGTIALNSILLSKGANILRVHDTLPAVDATRLISKL